MSNKLESRRDFLKTSAAGTAGLLLSGASVPKASTASSGGAWTDGMQINPAINNLRAVCAHDARLGTFDLFYENDIANEIMDKMAMALAQKPTAAQAWATIFQKPAGKEWPNVQVGFKANFEGPCLTMKVAKELNKLGVPYTNMIYFDHNTGGTRAFDIATKYPAGSPGRAFRWSGTAKSADDRMHGLTPAPVPYKGVTVNMNCATDIVNGTIDILITGACDADHSDCYGGTTLTCKSLYGVYNGVDSIQYLHGMIGGNPDGITGMLALQKSLAILGGTPPRQQLVLMNSASNPLNRIAMGTFAPIVDYLFITKIRGPVEGKTFNAAVVKRYYQDFGYTDADVAGLDFVDAMAYDPTGAIRPAPIQENSRLSLVVSNPSFKLSTIDFNLPYSEPLRVSVSVFDQKGRLVREFTPGWERSMMIAWDGKSQSGMRVPAGMYAIKVTNGNKISTGSLALVPR